MAGYTSGRRLNVVECSYEEMNLILDSNKFGAKLYISEINCIWFGGKLYISERNYIQLLSDN